MQKFKPHFLLYCFILFFTPTNAQHNFESSRQHLLSNYLQCLDSLSFIINQNQPFRKSVLLLENTFDSSSNDSEDIQMQLQNLAAVVKNHLNSNGIVKYPFKDSISYKINASICSVLTDTIKFKVGDTIIAVSPFTFNHSDPLGKQDITNTFVTTLLSTNQGNCRSLTYLYKILADELGAKCWIALAPGHMYIKNYSEKIGWYNTELTSGTFPTDAWIMASTYISGEAVKSGLYMDTLNNQQAIALCVLDLANIYESQTHNYYDGFILKCCDLVLKYHPVNPMALLLKAETLKKMVIKEKTSKYPKITATEKEMEATYLKLLDLGYREMPDKMYRKWLKELKANDEKYGNKKVEKSMK